MTENYWKYNRNKLNWYIDLWVHCVSNLFIFNQCSNNEAGTEYLFNFNNMHVLFCIIQISFIFYYLFIYHNMYRPHLNLTKTI